MSNASCRDVRTWKAGPEDRRAEGGTAPVLQPPQPCGPADKPRVPPGWKGDSDTHITELSRGSATVRSAKPLLVALSRRAGANWPRPRHREDQAPWPRRVQCSARVCVLCSRRSCSERPRAVKAGVGLGFPGPSPMSLWGRWQRTLGRGILSCHLTQQIPGPYLEPSLGWGAHSPHNNSPAPPAHPSEQGLRFWTQPAPRPWAPSQSPPPRLPETLPPPGWQAAPWHPSSVPTMG